MNSRTLSTLAIVAFVLLGLVFMGLRYRSIGQAQTAREDSHWRLSYEVSFEARQVDGEVRLALPYSTRHCEVLDETWFLSQPHPQLVRNVITLTPSNTRELAIVARQPGTYSVNADFDLRLSPRPRGGREPGLENLSGDARARYLREEDTIPVRDPIVREFIQSPDDSQTDAERIQSIFEFCAGLNSPEDTAWDTVPEALGNGSATPLGKVRTMVTLCRAIRIPARVVTGFEIRQDADSQQRHWVEVFLDQRWIPFDPQYGYTQYLPMNYLPVRRGGDRIVRFPRPAEATLDSARFFISRLSPQASVLASEVRHPLQIFNLLRLPVPMHELMSLLLLLPFGALITSFMRNVIGVQTFGTFAPALLALSFIYAAWQTGLAILIIVMTIGLYGRSMLERLRLLMVPRLSIVLTMVILCVVFSISALHFLIPTVSTQAVLLPMVILTILIERFHVTVEEDGFVFALQLALGTGVVAALCYAILRWEDVGRFILIYPESHFFTIAAFIALGRYAGYRLTELWRFRDLVESGEAPR